MERERESFSNEGAHEEIHSETYGEGRQLRTA